MSGTALVWPMRFVWYVVSSTLLTVVPAAAQTPASGSETIPFSRWVEPQEIEASARYNYVTDARDRTVQNRLQTQARIRGRFKVDPDGRFSVNAGLFTGSSFTSGWNPTGIGTGEGTANLYLKHLFAAAKPWDGIEFEYGSLAPERGESTEITTYDNDAYITAAGVNLTRPEELFFDQVTFRVGYVGYFDTPFVFDRTGAFSRQNYWQLMVSKKVAAGLSLSTDYSVIEEDGVLRQGVTWQTGHPVVDTVTGEYAVRLRGGAHDTAFAVSGEKEIAGVTVEVGYADVDALYGRLNGDRYAAGRRLFTSGTVPLPLDLEASWFVQKEISAPVTSRNDLRFDLVVTWNTLKALERVKRVP